MIKHIATAALAIALSPVPATAASDADVDALFEALRLPELMVVLSDEGLAQSAELSDAMFPERAGAFAVVAAGIYNPRELSRTFRAEFGNALADDDISSLIEFFTTDPGQEIVELEISARTAMLDPATEEAALAGYEDLAGTDPNRAEQIETFIESNDLIELNVMGGLNSSLAFYNGLASGGAFEMSQDEILGQVWSQEPELRDSSTEWLLGYMGLAYRPLSDDAFDSYIVMSESAAGADLNRALFAGYDAVFSQVSFSLGAAAAEFSKGEDL